MGGIQPSENKLNVIITSKLQKSLRMGCLFLKGNRAACCPPGENLNVPLVKYVVSLCLWEAFDSFN